MSITKLVPTFTYFDEEVDWEVKVDDEVDDLVQVPDVLTRCQPVLRDVDPAEGHGSVEPAHRRNVPNGHVQEAMIRYS